MSWNVGFNTTVNEDVGDEDVLIGTYDTFSEGMRALLRHAEELVWLNQQNQEDNSLMSLHADIRDITEDPGIMDDPDKWEDEEFYGEGISFWITEN